MLSRAMPSDIASPGDRGAVTGARGGDCVCCAKTVVAIENTNAAQTRDVLDIPVMRFKAAPTVIRNYIASVCMQRDRYPLSRDYEHGELDVARMVLPWTEHAEFSKTTLDSLGCKSSVRIPFRIDAKMADGVSQIRRHELKILNVRYKSGIGPEIGP